LEAAQDDSILNTIAPKAKQRNNFFILSLNWVNKLKQVLSKEGSVELVHQRENENNAGLLFFITFSDFFLFPSEISPETGFCIVKTLIVVHLNFKF
jgi:hypothetical protein